MKKIMIIFCSVFLIIAGCTKSKKDYEYGRIDLESAFKQPDYYRLSEVAEDIEYVFLETNDSCLVADIYSVVYDPPYYFITDRFETSIFIFDETGKYVHTISARGQGPQEYTKIDHYSVYNNVLYILDEDQRKILKYEVNGQCTGVFHINEYASGIKALNEDEILTVTLNCYLITFEDDVIPEIFDSSVKYKREGFIFTEYDRDFNLKRKFKYMKHTGSKHNDGIFSFYKHRDELVYWEYNIYDTVYTILPDGSSEARFIYDPGDIPSTLELRTDQNYGEWLSGHFELGSLKETDDYVFIFGIYNRYVALVLYNKKDNTTRGVTESLMNDIDGGISFWPGFKVSDNKFGTSLFPDKIKKYMARETADLKSGKDFYDAYRPDLDYDVAKHQKLLEQLEKTNDMSNPVLMIVTMKSSLMEERK